MNTVTKTLFAALAAIGAMTAVAAPAAAQAYGQERQSYDRGDRHDGADRSDRDRWDHDGGYDRPAYRGAHNGSYGRLTEAAQIRIENSIRSGRLDRREAWRLRTELREFARLEDRFGVNGYNMRERQILDRQFDSLITQVRVARNDRRYR